jgi:hypothetical protein
MPKAENTSKDGKAQNRRTEVKIDPALKSIMDAAKKN